MQVRVLFWAHSSSSTDFRAAFFVYINKFLFTHNISLHAIPRRSSNSRNTRNTRNSRNSRYSSDTRNTRNSRYSRYSRYSLNTTPFQQFAVGSLLLHKHFWTVLLPTVQQNCSAVGTVTFQKAIYKGLPPTTNCGK